MAVADVIKQSDNKNTIDLCCGTGNQVLWLRKAGIKHVTGVDVSDTMLGQAWRNGLKDVCLKMDASDTSFAVNSFDAAIMSFSLHETQVQIAEAIFSEAKRIVRPGGLIIVVDYCFDDTTRALGRFAARVVEKMVGGNHYLNFKFFVSTNLIKSFSEGMEIRLQKRFLLGAVAMWVFQNP